MRTKRCLWRNRGLILPQSQVDFDIVSTYQLNSTFPRLYTPAEAHLLLHPPSQKSETGVVWIASHCGRHNGRFTRDDFVSDLMKHMTVHAMGRCLHNQVRNSNAVTPSL